MKPITSKSTCSQPVNFSRSKTQQLKQTINNKQWLDILQGIDSIALKLQEISGQGKQNKVVTRSRGKTAKDRENQSKKIFRATAMSNFGSKPKQMARPATSMRKQSREAREKQQKSKSTIKNYKGNAYNRSQKVIKRFCTSASQFDEPYTKKTILDKGFSADFSQEVCISRCHQAQKQIYELRQKNDELAHKNLQLQKKLLQSKQHKNKGNTANQLVLKIMNSTDMNAVDVSQDEPICIQLKPTKYSRMTSMKSTSIQLQPPKKKPLLNLAKPSSPERPSSKPKKDNNQLKTLETEFDRLMEMSHLERNKARKKMIWEQMKSVAGQLKMMKYFTHN